MESVGGGFSLPSAWMVSFLFPSRCAPLAGSLPPSASLGISSLPSQHPPLRMVDIQHLFADCSFSEASYELPLGRGGWGQRALIQIFPGCMTLDKLAHFSVPAP